MDEDQAIVDLWRGQPLSQRQFDMQAVLKESRRFQRQVRYRNLSEYVAAGALAVWAAMSALKPDTPPLVKGGVVLMALAGLGVAVMVRVRGRAAPSRPPLAAPTTEVMRWHRAELTKQRDLLRGVPLWYLGPFVPGIAVAFAGAWLERPDQGLRIGLTAVAVLVVFAGVTGLNQRAVRKLDDQIRLLGAELEG